MSIEILISGKRVTIPSTKVRGRTVMANGRLLKVASIHEEMVTEGELIGDPITFISELKQSDLKADVFTFIQKVPETEPKYDYRREMENLAVVPITTYEYWLKKQATGGVRENVRKAGKRGVSVKSVPFGDELVRGIVDIYNETPFRQGRIFWHYGKDFATVKAETSHCLERSYFIGAYSEGELIGFIKLLRTGSVADIVLIMSRMDHRHARPTNALMAKTVEVCAGNQIAFLSYGEFYYFKKNISSLAEFKRRNGFEPFYYPRYYVPLTLKGRVALAFNLHHGIKGILPERWLDWMRDLRAKFLESGVARQNPGLTSKKVRG